MIGLVVALLPFLAALPASTANAPASTRWERLFTVGPTGDRYILGLWLNADGSWLAGGRGFIATGHDGNAKVQAAVAGWPRSAGRLS